MVRDSAQIILHQRFRIWRLLAMVALIGAALVVSTDHSVAQPPVDVVTTDTSITLTWSAEGEVVFFWYQKAAEQTDYVSVTDAKSWTATGLQPESEHEFRFYAAFFGTLEVTTDASTTPPSTPEVSIAAGANITEGGDATFTLTATPAPTQAIDVKVSPLLAGDYGIPSAIKTVSVPTSGTATVTFPTTDDSVDETDGSVTASIVSGTGYTSSSTNGSATVAIADNDVPELSITSDSDVTEGTAASFTITASPTPHTALSVDVGVSASGSFGVTTGTQTITVPTSGSQTFTVSTSGDTTDEPDGSVTVLLGSGTGYVVSSSASSATAAISDDDVPPTPDPEVSISAGSAITEGSDATFTISVTPTQSATLDVSVTVSQTGAYASTGQQTVTIPTSGSYTLTVSTTNDTTDELDGSIVATLDSGTGYTVSSSNGHATVAVSDDDDPPTPVAQSEQQQISHCLTGNILQTVRGYYDSNKNNSPNYGKNWKRVLITFHDVTDENLTPYTAAEALQSETRWSGWKPVREAIQCIELVFPAPSSDPEISIAGSADVTEGTSVSFTVTATPAPSANLDVSVNVTQSGSFTTQTGAQTVTIGATGSTSFAISTDNDTTDEPDGSVTATVETGTGYSVSSSAATATVAVADDDDAPDKQQNTTPTITIADASASEGDSLTFTVSVNPTHTSAITLDYETVDGTAISHADVNDYTAKTGTVTIPAGDSSATFAVSTTEDSDIEINDTFTVVISNPPTGVTIGDDTATGTISNDDTGSVGEPVSILRNVHGTVNNLYLIRPQTTGHVGVFENGETKEWHFRLRDKPPYAITLRPVVSDARDAHSLVFTPSYLVFTPSNWDTYQALTVRHIGVWGLHVGRAWIPFEAAEHPGLPTLFSLGVDMYGAGRTHDFTLEKPESNVLTEGGTNASLTYRVKLDEVPRNPITVTITNPDPGSVTVSPMSFVFSHKNYDEFQDFTITPVADGDSDDEDVEITVTVPISHPHMSKVTKTFRVAVEESIASVRVGPQTLTLDEGGSGHYDVWLRTDPGNGKSVTVTPTFTGSAITVSPTTLTFTGGSTGNWQTKQRVTVSTVRDANDENENVSISHTISGDGDGYNSQTPSQSVGVSVLDGDGKVEIEFDRNNNLVLDEGNTSGVDIRVRLSHDPGPAGGSNNQVVMTTHPTGTHLVADPTTLTFTTGPTGNWNDWQTLTIKPASGKHDDGNAVHERHWVKVALGMSPHQLQDLPGYPDTVNDVVARPIDIFYFDDEIADDLHLEHSALTVDEGGSAVKYKLTLGGDPGGPVTVTITNPDPTKLTISPTTVTFPYGGQGDWHIQEVTLTALDDSDPQDETLVIVHDYSVSGYANTQQTLTVTIDDDDELGLSVSSATVEVNETSSTTYDVHLNGDPGDGASVVVTPVSGDTTRLTVSGAVTFTGGSSGDWMTPQTVTLNAPVDDNYKKDTVTITHTITGFAGVSTTPSVTATIADAPLMWLTWTSDPTDRIAPNSTLTLTEGTPGEVFIHFDPDLLAEGDYKDEWFAAMASGDKDGPVIFMGLSGSGQYGKNFFWSARSAGENCDGRYPRPRSTSSKYCDTIDLHSEVDANTTDETRWFKAVVDNLSGYGVAAPGRLNVIIKDTSIAMQAYPSTVFPIEDVAATEEVWVRLKRQPEAGVTVTVEPEIQSTDSTKVSVGPSSLTFDSTNWDTFQKFDVTASSDVDTSNEDVSFKLKGTASDSLVIVPNVGIDVSILDDD